MITINKDRCPQDHKCPAMNICPVNAISQTDFNLPEVDNSKCLKCLKCVNYCPKGAIIVDDSENASKQIEIDACGMQCPGPIVRLKKEIEKIENGSIIKIKTTDPGFKLDIQNWCESTGNTLIKTKEEKGIIEASIQKNKLNFKKENSLKQKNDKTIVLFSNDLDKALAAFIIANGAAATGKNVIMFFTFWGLNILRKPESSTIKKGVLNKIFGSMMPKGADKLVLSKMNMFGIGTFMMKYIMKKKNVLTLYELIQQAKANGVKFIICQMSLDVMGLKPEELINGIELGGVASYINSAENSDMNLFI